MKKHARAQRIPKMVYIPEPLLDLLDKARLEAGYSFSAYMVLLVRDHLKAKGEEI